MRESLERAWAELPGVVQRDARDIVVLFMLVLAITIAYNRGYRRTERGPLVRMPLLLLAGATVLLVRHVHEMPWRVGLGVAVLLVAGLIGKRIHPRGLWMLMVIIAAIIGSGWMLSALVFSAFLFIVLLLSPTERR
ncbi:MAG TPA: hypothetical protein VGE21_05515 [Flavobacteriales bacterium]